jgi:hypothetical protein
MPEITQEEISRERFSTVFGRVNESSGRTRSVLYIFMIANFALFLTVYGANLYRRPVERLTDFLDAVVCLKNTDLTDDQKPRAKSRLDCKTAREDADFGGYDFAALKGITLADSVKQEPLTDILIRKRMEALVTEDAASKRVQIPFVGFSFDIDYLWLLVSFFGPLGMIMILACLRSELEGIKFADQYLKGPDSEERAYRARLLLSTQVLLRVGEAGTTIDDVTGRAQRGFLYSIFLLPVLTQAVMIYWDSFLVDLPDWEYFKNEVRAEWSGHTSFETVWLITAVLSMTIMILSALQFVKIRKELSSEYKRLSNY